MHRHLAKDVVDLRHVGDAAAHDTIRAPAGDVLAVEDDGTAADAHQPEHRLHRRRLARAVGADDDHDFLRHHRERDALQDVGIAIATAHLVHDEDGLGAVAGRGRIHAASSVTVSPR